MQSQFTRIWKALPLLPKVAALLLLVTGLVSILAFGGVVSSLLIPPISDSGQINSQPLPNSDLYGSDLDTFKNTIICRSPFFLPNKNLDALPDIIDDNPGFGGDKPPYGGPRLIGIIGTHAYFDKELSNDRSDLEVGRGAGNLHLVSIEAPWTAHVRWGNYKYALQLLDTNNLNFGTSSDFGASLLGSGSGNDIMGNGSSRRTTETIPNRRGKGNQGFDFSDDIGLERGQLFLPANDDDDE